MVLHYSDTGAGEPLLLLHGMAGSLHYWDAYVETLSKTRRVIAVDLLGFGRSPQSANGYTAQEHCSAIRDTLKQAGISAPIEIAGHSMGALLALKYALLYPKSVSRLLFISMPIFQSPAEARASITKGRRTLQLAYYGWTSQILCTVWCYGLRPVSKRLAQLYLPRLPHAVARDSVLHSWHAYMGSMLHVIENQSVNQDLAKLKVPCQIICGQQEDRIILKNIEMIYRTYPDISFTKLDGTHNIALEQTKAILPFLVRNITAKHTIN